MNLTNYALASHLKNQSWDAFFTSTFRVHQRYSATAIDIVQRKLLTPRLHPVKTFIAAEQHYLGGWHTHGLLQYPATDHSLDFLIASDKAILAEVGFNVISHVNDLDACSAYLSKYITKGEFTGDWRMSGRRKFWNVI